MIIYTIIRQENAHYDIESIYYYIKFKLLNPIASENFLKGITAKIDSLELFPYIGSIYKNSQNRFIIYKNFLIFYEIQEKEKLVIIKSIINRRKNAKESYIM